MTKNTGSITLDRESLARFARLLGNHSSVTGAHCGDDDGDVDGVFSAGVALGVHCGDDDDVVVTHLDVLVLVRGHQRERAHRLTL